MTCSSPLDDDIPSSQWTVYPWETPHFSTKKLSSNPHSWQGRHVSWRECMAIMEFKSIVDFPPGRVTSTWLGGSKCWFWPQHGAVTSCNRQTWFSKWDWQLRTPHVGKSKNNYIYICSISSILVPAMFIPGFWSNHWQSYPAPQKHILRQARGMIGAALTEAWESGSAKLDVKMGTDS